MKKLNNLFRIFISNNNRTFSTSNFSGSSLSELLPDAFINIKPISTEVNNLNLKSGEFRYLKDIKLSSNIKWDSGAYIFKSLGYLNDIDSINRKLQILFNSLSKEQSYSILFIIKSQNSFKTLNRQYLINYDSNVQNIIKSLYERIDILTLKYNFSIDDFLSCKYRPLYIKLSNQKAITPPIKSEQTKFILSKFYSNAYIPNTMDLSFYGVILKQLTDPGRTLYLYNNKSKLLVTFIEKDKFHRIDMLSSDGEQIICTFIDEKFDDHFIRVIVNNDLTNPIHFKYDFNFNLIQTEFETNYSFMSPINKELTHNSNILTFDIETYLDGNSNSVPYSCGFYDGQKCYTYYSSDFESPEIMLMTCISHMMEQKYKNFVVYAHNLSNFDAIFLYKLIYLHYKVKFISKDNDILSFTISSLNSMPVKQRSKLIFRDSARLLPGSLKRLGESFQVDVTKGIFPYSFVNQNTFNYIGEIPEFKYYNQDSETKRVYNDYPDSFKKSWSLRSETISYLEKDLVSLYQIVSKMSYEIYKSYRLNISKFSTLSGLALAIYRSNFMPKNARIVNVKGNIDKAIRSAYYGGAVDVYKPTGSNLYYYDANSLYPAAMLMPMPVGVPTYSTMKNLEQIFGFVKATVTSPNIYNPTLPCKVQTASNEYRLIFPNGTWTAWFFSEELKDAVLNHGYKAIIHESYLFERSSNIFENYVESIGFIKQNTTGATREIHKLLLNSLYGRMGMNNQAEEINVVTSEEAIKIHLTHRVVDNFKLTPELEYIRYSNEPVQELCELSGIDYHELCIASDHSYREVTSSSAIAAAVTAWGRIMMNKIKFIHGNKFLYGDTDSGILEKPLNQKLLGNEIGQFKQEYPLIKNALFISPKLYFLELMNGDVITKGRGYSGKLSKYDYLQLYFDNTINVVDKRWRRNLELSTMNIEERVIKLSPFSMKRNKLYSLGKWVDTSPLCVNSDGSISCIDLTIIPTPQSKYAPFIKLLNSLKRLQACSSPLTDSNPTILSLPQPGTIPLEAVKASTGMELQIINKIKTIGLDEQSIGTNGSGLSVTNSVENLNEALPRDFQKNIGSSEHKYIDTVNRLNNKRLEIKAKRVKELNQDKLDLLYYEYQISLYKLRTYIAVNWQVLHNNPDLDVKNFTLFDSWEIASYSIKTQIKHIESNKRSIIQAKKMKLMPLIDKLLADMYVYKNIVMKLKENK